MWPFRKKTPPPPRDVRNWNEDWRVGDIAECIVDGVTLQWHECLKPWQRPAFGQHLTVSGFSEGVSVGFLAYYLQFSDWPVGLTTTAFRKVRKVEAKDSITAKILKAKPGPDKVRDAPSNPLYNREDT